MKFKINVKTLYYKYDMDGDWSVRYHLIFKDRKQYEKQWILKSHNDKSYVKLSKKEAQNYIEKYNSKQKLLMGFELGELYKKIELNEIGDLNYYLDIE